MSVARFPGGIAPGKRVSYIVFAAAGVAIFLLATSIYFVQQYSIDSLILPYSLGTRGFALVYPLVITVLVAPAVYPLYVNDFVQYVPTRLRASMFLRGIYLRGALSASIPIGIALFLLSMYSFFIEPMVQIGNHDGQGVEAVLLEASRTAPFGWILQISPLLYAAFQLVWNMVWATLWSAIVTVCVTSIRNRFIALAMPTIIYLIDVFILQLFVVSQPLSGAVAIFPQMLSPRPDVHPLIALLLYSCAISGAVWWTFRRGFIRS